MSDVRVLVASGDTLDRETIDTLEREMGQPLDIIDIQHHDATHDIFILRGRNA